MITQVKITPIRKRGTVTITGSYYVAKTGKQLNLLASGDRVVSSLSEGDRIFQHVCESGQPLVLKLDPDNREQAAIIQFWKNHPLIVTAGYDNPNLMNPSFEFEIHDERVNVDYDALVSKLRCVQIVSTMSLRERQNLAFALGSDPREMTAREVYIHLIGLTLEGIAIAKRDQVFNFMSVRGAEKAATVYAQKAIRYGIIIKDGSIYKVGGRNLGGSVDSVIAAILADEQLFENYIQPEVDKRDKDELSQAAPIEDPLLNGLPEGVAELLPKGVVESLPVTSSKEKKEAAKANKPDQK